MILVICGVWLSSNNHRIDEITYDIFGLPNLLLTAYIAWKVYRVTQHYEKTKHGKEITISDLREILDLLSDIHSAVEEIQKQGAAIQPFRRHLLLGILDHASRSAEWVGKEIQLIGLGNSPLIEDIKGYIDIYYDDLSAALDEAVERPLSLEQGNNERDSNSMLTEKIKELIIWVSQR